MVRLALRGGDAVCSKCGSLEVRRSWSIPTWHHALGLDACHCDVCGESFHVPRRAATAEMYDEPADPSQQLTLPEPPEVDLNALDREMAVRLGRRSKSAE